MDWQPDRSALSQLALLLADTLDARDKAKQKNAEEVRNALSLVKDICLILYTGAQTS